MNLTLTPYEFNKLGHEEKAAYLGGLTSDEFKTLTHAIAHEHKRQVKQSEQRNYHNQTTDLPNPFEYISRRRRELGRRATLVDVIADEPWLKTNPAIMQMVRDDFARIIQKRK